MSCSTVPAARPSSSTIGRRETHHPQHPEASGPDGFMTAALPYSYGQPEPRNELADKLKPRRSRVCAPPACQTVISS